MAAAPGTWSSLTVEKPTRIEGHTSNVETPVLYRQYITGTVAETIEAGDTYVVPHKITNPKFVTIMPLTGASANILGVGATASAWVDLNGYAFPWTACGTAATAGATSIVLTGATDVADHYNGATLDIRHVSGNIQTVTITDYAATTLLATIDTPLTEAVTTSSAYRVRGGIMTCPSPATTPTVKFEVIGTFE